MLVHATGFCKETWRPVEGRLAGQSMLIADQRGHGDSQAPQPPFDWWDLGRDALTWLDDAAWDGVTGVGHSAGAAALAMAEILQPGTFSALVLIEPIIFPPPFGRMETNPMSEAAIRRRSGFDDVEDARASYLGRGPFARWDIDALNAYVEYGFRSVGGRWVLKCSAEVEAEFYRAATAHGAWERLGEIGCPVTLVAGADSESHPERFVREQAARFASAEIHLVAGATHFVPMERPGAVSRIVKDVLPAAD
jgi:pimeloyl-ACP methyl ester carboxylesterase